MPNDGAGYTWQGRVTARRAWKVRVVHPAPEPLPADVAAFEALDDSALVEASLAGRREAFDVIVERHRRQVYHVCYRFVGNHEDASDLAQDVFVRAWRALGQFKRRAAVSTWLYRIAVNVCLNRLALRRPDFDEVEPNSLVDRHVEDPRARLIERERAVAVRQAILHLPDKQRATLILRTYHDLSHQQIADILGSSVGAVKANFFHALANLKRILGREP
ncbi:MAG: RNA polymerase sigma factor [Vicinamibacterales bacterium]